jgi:hypothetical protein
MENPFFSSRHPIMQLLAMVLITIISTLAVMLLSLIAGIFIFSLPLNEWVNLLDMNNPANLPVLKFMQITQSLSMFVIPPMVFGWFMMRNPLEYLSLNKKPDNRLMISVLVLAVAILPVINLLGLWNESMKLPGFLSGIEEWMKKTEEQAGVLTEAFLTVNTFPGYLVNVLMIVLIPAFGEEFFFRGVLQKVFIRWFKNAHVAIIFVAIIFSAFHFQFYGFMPRVVLGLIFGYLFYWSGNIWYPVIAHAINNFIPVSLTYFFREKFDPAELDQVGAGPDSWWWALPAVVLSIAVITYFYKTTKSQLTNNSLES